jgi:hypothetical protein
MKTLRRKTEIMLKAWGAVLVFFATLTTIALAVT